MLDDLLHIFLHHFIMAHIWMFATLSKKQILHFWWITQVKMKSTLRFFYNFFSTLGATFICCLLARGACINVHNSTNWSVFFTNFLGNFHPDDLQRIHNNLWLDNFLFFHDYNVKAAFTQCWSTLEWRKKVNVNGAERKLLKVFY